MSEKPVTRVDIEICGTGLLVRKWFAGWQDDGSTPADSEDYVTGKSIPGMLADLEKDGFACEMCDRAHGRALRGEITRIDILKLAGEWRVRKYPHGWRAVTKPISDTVIAPEKIAEAVDWCKARGWKVISWSSGYRAFRYAVKPVRDRASIKAMTKQIDEAHARGQSDERGQYDLAFYF